MLRISGNLFTLDQTATAYRLRTFISLFIQINKDLVNLNTFVDYQLNFCIF